MPESKTIRIDGIKWYVSGNPRFVQPLCPTHHLRMRPVVGSHSQHLKCADCETLHPLPRTYGEEQIYVLDSIDAKIFKGMPTINLDDEAIPLAEEKDESGDEKYFAVVRLVRSKVGLRLIAYAGEKGKKEKSQIFVEPDIRRLSFDQKDIHPADVFVKLEGTFSDGTKGSIEKE